MVETRLQRAQRLLRITMDLGENSPLEKALVEANQMDIRNWFSLKEEEINDLSYDENGTEKLLRSGDTIYLKAFIAYVD